MRSRGGRLVLGPGGRGCVEGLVVEDLPTWHLRRQPFHPFHVLQGEEPGKGAGPGRAGGVDQWRWQPEGRRGWVMNLTVAALCHGCERGGCLGSGSVRARRVDGVTKTVGD